MYIFGAESLATLELEGMILSLIRASPGSGARGSENRMPWD